MLENGDLHPNQPIDVAPIQALIEPRCGKRFQPNRPELLGANLTRMFVQPIAWLAAALPLLLRIGELFFDGFAIECRHASDKNQLVFLMERHHRHLPEDRSDLRIERRNVEPFR